MNKPAALVVDAAGFIRAWTPGATELFGHEESTARGQTLDLIVPPEFRERHWAGLGRAMAAGSSMIDGEAAILPVLCSDGAVRRFAGRLSLLRDPAGEVVGAFAVYCQTGDVDAPLPMLGG